MNHTLSTFPKKILIGIQEGSCNLKCPKCYTHGTNSISSNVRPKGVMDFEKFKLIINEVKNFKPRIGPQTWDEPFLNSKIYEYLEVIKTNDLEVTIDTNGLLLKTENLQHLIDLKIDSIFISLDAFYNETYQQVRGVNKLDELKSMVHEFINLRGNNSLPRIGVSFVLEDSNYIESQLFINYWSQYVDVVRVNELFMGERRLKKSPTHKRTSCWSLDDTLMIHNNGEAALCCVDTHYETQVGNVFSDGVINIWNGKFFNQVRKHHNDGNFNEISICKNCDLWSHDKPQNETTDKLLISKTGTHSYYNKLDRMDNIIKNNRFI